MPYYGTQGIKRFKLWDSAEAIVVRNNEGPNSLRHQTKCMF